MNSPGLIAIPAVLLFVGYYYYTLVGTTRLSTRRIWLVPLVLAFFTVTNAPADLRANPSLLLATLVSIALGAAVGFTQGWSMTIYRGSDGALWQRGSVTSTLIVLGSIPLRYGLRYLLFGGSSFTQVNSDVLFTYLAMGLALVVARALAIVVKNPVMREQFI